MATRKTRPKPAVPPWLAPALAYIPQWLGFQMRVTEQPGCAVAVVHKGKLVLEAAFGHADLAAGEKITPRHRFRVASHSKTFTAAAILKLREQRRLKLDDAIGEYVDGLHVEIATATIGQLLSHTAGVLRDGPDSAYWVGRAAFLDEGSLRRELALAPVIDANTRLKYSNHGFGLLGLAIEAITGEPYGSWVEREIVRAAGLRETIPDVPLPAKAKLARGHSGKALLGRRLVFPGDQSTHALASATGFVSTAADLARFFAQLAPNAPKSILSAASRREMTRPQWRDPFAVAPRTYGLGTISGDLEGWSWFGHSGGFQGYLTRTACVPAQGLTVSVLTNAGDGPSDVWLEGALHILKRFAAEGAPTAKTADWSGRWWSVWGATDLAPMGGKVLLAAPALGNPFAKVAELTVASRDEARISEAGAFASYGEPVRRLRNRSGKVTGVVIAGSLSLPEKALTKELLDRYG
jgi:CubicO group peptidase (beta-lactamase class C family)